MALFPEYSTRERWKAGNWWILRLRWIQSDAQFCCSSVTERFKNRTVLQSQIYSSATYSHTRWFRLLSPGALLKYPPRTVIFMTCKIVFVDPSLPRKIQNKVQIKNKQTKTTTTPRQQASVQLLVDFTRSCPAPIPGHNNVVRTKIKKIRYPYKRAHCTRAACLSGGGGKGKKRYYPSPDA